MSGYVPYNTSTTLCKIEVLFFQNIICGGVFQKKVLFVHEYIFITILSADELLDKNGWAKTSLFMGQKTSLLDFKLTPANAVEKQWCIDQIRLNQEVHATWNPA